MEEKYLLKLQCAGATFSNMREICSLVCLRLIK